MSYPYDYHHQHYSEYQCPRSVMLQERIDSMNYDMQNLYKDNELLRECNQRLKLEVELKIQNQTKSREYHLLYEDNVILSKKVELLEKNEKEVIFQSNKLISQLNGFKRVLAVFLNKSLKFSSGQNDKKIGTSNQQYAEYDQIDQSNLNSSTCETSLNDISNLIERLVSINKNCTCQGNRESKSSTGSEFNKQNFKGQINSSSTHGCKNCNCCSLNSKTFNDFEYDSKSCTIKTINCPPQAQSDEIEKDGEAFINIDGEDDEDPQLGADDEDAENMLLLKDTKIEIDLAPACIGEPAICHEMLLREVEIDVGDFSSKFHSSKNSLKKKLCESKVRFNEIKDKFNKANKQLAGGHLNKSQKAKDSNLSNTRGNFHKSKKADRTSSKARSHSSDKEVELVNRLSKKKVCPHNFEYYYGEKI